jgi:DsbC/DsbD-like thiol-disulfide interchange protein
MRTLMLTLALAALATTAAAQDSLVEARVLNGWQTEDGTQMTGLALSLAPGWKTYWRAPGDAGIPPVFDWSASQNVKSARIHWPAPHAFTTNGLRSIGYAETVVLPVELTPRDPALPMHLGARVDLGVCREVCVPATLRIDASLTAPGAPDPAIDRALAERPLAARKAGVKSAHCRITPIGDGLRVEAELVMPPAGGSEVVVIEAGSSEIWVSEAEVSRDGARLTATAEMVGPSGEPFALDRGELVLTVLGSRRAVEIRGCEAG